MKHHVFDPHPHFQEMLSALNRLILYRNLRKDPVVLKLHEAIDSFLKDRLVVGTGVSLYHQFLGMLAQKAEYSRESIVGCAWQNHLADLILEDENPFTLKAGGQSWSFLSPALQDAARNDLLALQTLYHLDRILFRQALLWDIEDEIPPGTVDQWQDFAPFPHGEESFQASLRQEMKETMQKETSWQHLLPPLAAYYRKAGTSLFGRFKAFRWAPAKNGSPLKGIFRPDLVQLEDLIGYDLAREEIISNTEKFLKGYSANNVLLYGDRGTGKSSTVKAILNAYCHSGLRLIEVSRQHLQDFPQIISFIKNYPQRFILFVDDLSFEDSELNYKDLKAVLEGGLEVRPPNVVIYATSNRRHLIKERFEERGVPRKQAGEDEVHQQDTTQEKLSLADRFGITVTFTSPDQQTYLEIVAGLARKRGLDIDPTVLKKRALKWELWQNARSGRTARQFIDYLEAELAED